MKIIDDIWFANFQGMNTIGIVIGEDEVTGERKAYIGFGLSVSRQDDMQTIAANGAKLTPEIAARIASLLNPPKPES